MLVMLSYYLLKIIAGKQSLKKLHVKMLNTGLVPSRCFPTKSLRISVFGGCTCSVRNIMKRPVTKLPSQSSKGTKQKKYVVPPHLVGVLKSWDSKHTG